MERTILPEAFVLLNTEIGKESQVLKDLRGIDGVQEAYRLWGGYDIIANIKAENIEKLKFIIRNRIEKIGKINSKQTMIISDYGSTSSTEYFVLETPAAIQ
jgi:DNA-binding Lrp family transcriptional regulator